MSSTEIIVLREKFLLELRQGKLCASSEYSYGIAKATVNFTRKLIASRKYNTFEELMALLQSEGNIITKAEPTDFIVENMVLRVLKLVRDEQNRLISGCNEGLLADSHDALHKLWLKPESAQRKTAPRQLQKAAIETINEFLTELENSRENIAAQAPDHILDDDIVMTIGYCVTVEAFLKMAAMRRQFRVLIVECAPSNEGRILANGLNSICEVEGGGSRCISVEVVADTDLLPAMSRVTRVVIGATSVLADGSCVGLPSTLTLCLAAKAHSVPVIVCAEFYKFTPKFLTGVEEVSRLLSPCSILPFSEASELGTAMVANPLFDLIAAELISLYIPQTFGITPAHVYRLLGEYFHPDDIERTY